MNWYGFIIALGIIACLIGAYFAARVRGIESDFLFNIIIVGLPVSILGARIYYVVFDLIAGGDWDFPKFFGFSDDKFAGLSGLAIYGGVLGAIASAAILAAWTRRKKNPADKRISFTQILDLAFTFVILGQAIGRWGNFANAEAHGYAITNPSLMWFPLGVNVSGTWYYATFFYEFMWNIIGFGALLFLYIGKRRSFDGFSFAGYCIYYGIGRAWIEGMREDSLWLIPPTNLATGAGGVRVSQLVSILFIVAGVAIIVAHIIRAKKAGKKIFILIPKEKCCSDYFGYDFSKMAHPMPGTLKKGKKPEVVVDENGVAVLKHDDGSTINSRDSTLNGTGDGSSTVKKEHGADDQPVVKAESAAPQKTEDAYEDGWDD